MAATAMTDISTHGTTNLLFSKMSNVPATVKTWTVQHSNPGMEREDPETEMEYDNGIGKLSLSVENAFLVIKPKADSETKYVCDDGGLLLTIRGYDELDKEIGLKCQKYHLTCQNYRF